MHFRIIISLSLSLVSFLFVGTVAVAGPTIINGSGNDTIEMVLGADLVDGGGGTDILRLPLFPNTYEVLLPSQGQSTYSLIYEGVITLVQNVEYFEFGNQFRTTIAVNSILPGQLQDDTAKLTDLYLAFFGRAPDVEGLEYWLERFIEEGMNFTDISKHFAWSPEAQALYPQDGSNRDFVQKVYQNCFGRNPDSDGWNYWTNRLNALGVTDLNDRGAFVGELLLGAYAPTSGARDRDLLTNRHEVALFYVNYLSAQPQEGFDTAINDLLLQATNDSETQGKAKGVIDYVFRNPETLSGVMNNTSLFDSLWANGTSSEDPIDISDGLISYYPFDGNGTDVIGGRHGVSYGSPTYVQGQVGQALHVTNGNFIRVPSSIAYVPGSDDLTISLKVFVENDDSFYGKTLPLVSFQGGDYREGFLLRMDNSLEGNPRVAVFAQPDGFYDPGIKAYASAGIGGWIDVASVLNWSSKTVEIYVDGALTHTEAFSDVGSIDSTWDMLIGAYNWSPPYGSGDILIDELRIHNRALSAEEIAYIAGYDSGEEEDTDSDGYTESQGDCDDSDPNVNPGATEQYDSVDNDCDGMNNEGYFSWYRDADGDGFGDAATVEYATSQPAGYVADNTDCDDSEALKYPGATEICGDGIDQNCDGDVDEECETVNIKQELITPDGGVIEITDPASPIYGFKMEIPEGALIAEETIRVEYSSQSIPVPEGIQMSEGYIDLLPDGLYFSDLVEITVPYNPDIEMPIVVSYSELTGTYEVLPVINIDSEQGYLKLVTNHFSGLLKIKNLSLFGAYSTGFTLGVDNFYTNNTSDLFNDGACWGFSVYSKWYFQNKKNIDGINLFDRYRCNDANREIEIIKAANNHIDDKFIRLISGAGGVVAGAAASDKYTSAQLMASMTMTGNPQLLNMFNFAASPIKAHAILITSWSNNGYEIVFTGYDNQDNTKEVEVIYNTITQKLRYKDYITFLYSGYEAFAAKGSMNQVYERYKDDYCFALETLSPPRNVELIHPRLDFISMSFDCPVNLDNVDGYVIYSYPDEIEVLDLPWPEFCDVEFGFGDNLAPNTEYCFVVASRDASYNFSQYSEPACGKTLDPNDVIPPAKPLNFSVVRTESPDMFEFSWEATSDNDTPIEDIRYPLYTNGINRYSEDYGFNSRDGIKSGFYDPAQDWCFRLSAIDRVGNESSWSNEVCLYSEIEPEITYSWETSAWGLCTGDCGDNKGTQIRTVSCRSSSGETASDSACETTKPNTSQSCTVDVCESKFTDNGDGTVRDNRTGQIWQKTDDNVQRNWNEAKNYCNGLTLGGSSDWQLPNLERLGHLALSLTVANEVPYSNSKSFPGTNAASYWSSSPHTISGWAYFVDFSRIMTTSYGSSTSSLYVRCER